MDKLAKILIKTFPLEAALEDGTHITLRPLLKEDGLALLAYFQGLPPEDRLRLRDDVTDPQVIANWIDELDYDEVLPLVAWNNQHVVGNATLHFSPIGWTKHQGEVRLTTAPQYRTRGLGTIMVQNLLDLASALGLEQISIEVLPVWDQAFHFFEKLGFKEVAQLPGFVKDLEGNESDLVIMVKYLT